jgi:hypothetical protein
MDREVLNKAYEEIPDFKDKLGENVLDAVTKEERDPCKMAEEVIRVFSSCKTKKELEAADNMLMAVCGYNLEKLVQRINRLDECGYLWKNC